MTVERASEQFVALAGLRGVAAIAVVQFHGNAFLGGVPLPAGYLAVDFFFLLSGWVLAHAYDARLAAGLGAAQFLRLRLLRLYPVYLLALALATAADLGDGTFSLPWLLASLVFLPALWIDNGYWMIGPAWSLVAELLANLPFAIVHRRLGPKLLWTAVAAGFLALLFTAFAFGDLNRGHSLGNWWGMLGRVFFSFPLGILLYRGRNRLAAWGPAWSTWPSFAVLGGLLALPSFGHTPLRDLAVVVVALPALLLFTANARPGAATARLAVALGAMSYPLYLLHAPMMDAAGAVLRRLSGTGIAQLPPPGGLLFLAAAIALALLVDRRFDTPVRRGLAGRTAAPRLRRAA